MIESLRSRGARRGRGGGDSERKRPFHSAFLPRAHRVHHGGIDELESALHRVAVIPWFDGRGAVEYAMLALRFRRELQLTPRRSIHEVELVKLRLRRLRPGQRQLAGRHLEMLHEVAADQIVGVAESRFRLAIGGEEESRVLNGVTRQYEAPRAGAILFSVESAVPY